MELGNLVYFAAFLQGITNSLHCIGMCGPLAISFQSPKLSPSINSAFYNLGRFISYITIGSILGLTGSALNQSIEIQGIQKISAVFAFLVLFILSLGMIFPSIKNKLYFLSGVPAPIKPLFQKTRNLENPYLANMLLGSLSGFLPCGVLYPAYAIAFGTGNMLYGGLVMLSFFGGTVPSMYLFQIGYNSLKTKISQKYLPVFGVLILLFGMGSLYLRMGIGSDKPHCHDPKTENHFHH